MKNKFFRLLFFFFGHWIVIMNSLHFNMAEIDIDAEMKEMMAKIRVTKGDTDTFDYEGFKQFLFHYNNTLAKLSCECESWKAVFAHPHTLTEASLEKNESDYEIYSTFQKTLIQAHIIHNMFLHKNEV